LEGLGLKKPRGHNTPCRRKNKAKKGESGRVGEGQSEGEGQGNPTNSKGRKGGREPTLVSRILGAQLNVQIQKK